MFQNSFLEFKTFFYIMCIDVINSFNYFKSQNKFTRVQYSFDNVLLDFTLAVLNLSKSFPLTAFNHPC